MLTPCVWRPPFDNFSLLASPFPLLSPTPSLLPSFRSSFFTPTLPISCFAHYWSFPSVLPSVQFCLLPSSYIRSDYVAVRMFFLSEFPFYSPENSRNRLSAFVVMNPLSFSCWVAYHQGCFWCRNGWFPHFFSHMAFCVCASCGRSGRKRPPCLSPSSCRACVHASTRSSSASSAPSRPSVSFSASSSMSASCLCAPFSYGARPFSLGPSLTTPAPNKPLGVTLSLSQTQHMLPQACKTNPVLLLSVVFRFDSCNHTSLPPHPRSCGTADRTGR